MDRRHTEINFDTTQIRLQSPYKKTLLEMSRTITSDLYQSNFDEKPKKLQFFSEWWKICMS